MKHIGRAVVTRRLQVVVSAFAILAGLALVMASPQVGMGQAAGERVIYMAAIEPKGGVTVDKEPYPGAPLPKGGGYVLNAPNPQGRWEVSVYQWSPSTIVVRQGERVALEIVGINGAKHSAHIDRYIPHHFEDR